MKSNNLQSNPSEIPHATSILSLAAALLTIIFLGLLHILSPELQPSWRMVSEYANGNFSWVLSLMFISWAVSSWALAYTLRSQIKTRLGKVGLGFLVAAGVGELMASMFDINHSLHTLASLIGIGGIVIASILISISLGRTKPWSVARRQLLTTAHLIWISVVLMVISFIVLISTYMSAGGDTTAGTSIQTIPDGVIAVVGYANRLVVLASCAWVAVVAWRALKLRS